MFSFPFSSLKLQCQQKLILMTNISIYNKNVEGNIIFAAAVLTGQDALENTLQFHFR